MSRFKLVQNKVIYYVIQVCRDGERDMKKMIGISAIMFIALTNSYAIETPSVQQGAEKYDWQSCLDAKTNDCTNNCSNSEDINCGDNCADMAKDKCQSIGISPPGN